MGHDRHNVVFVWRRFPSPTIDKYRTLRHVSLFEGSERCCYLDQTAFIDPNLRKILVQKSILKIKGSFDLYRFSV